MISFYIARRYLLSKKSHTAINIISGISVCGVAIATAALVCILSVFNGFQDMVADLFTSFDPELKIIPAEEKFMAENAKELKAVKDCDFVDVYCEVLEDNALVNVKERQVMVTIKGVDDSFERLTSINDILIGDGGFELRADVIDYGIPGAGILQQLGLSVDYQGALQVYAPCGGEHIDVMDPSESFNVEQLYSSRSAFVVRQSKYDSHYIITGKDFAQRLFDKEGKVTAIELCLKRGTSISEGKKTIQNLLGDGYKVLDRYEQQESTFNIMQIEKLISYIFLTFILMVACFNIIGSLSMLIIDKKDDAVTLRNLGANDSQISSIFMIEGRLITLLGAVVGIAIGLTLCYVQEKYGVVSFGSSEGEYIIDTYPVSVHGMDILVVFATVIVVGFVSVWYPVKSLTRKFTL